MSGSAKSGSAFCALPCVCACGSLGDWFLCCFFLWGGENVLYVVSKPRRYQFVQHAVDDYDDDDDDADDDG